jgi:hypothetical protein
MVFMQKAAVNVVLIPPQSGGIRMDNDLAVFFQEDTIQSF